MTDTTTENTTTSEETGDLDVFTLFENDPKNQRCRFTFRTANAEIIVTYHDRQEAIHLVSNLVSLLVEASSLVDTGNNEVEPFDIEFSDSGFDAANQ